MSEERQYFSERQGRGPKGTPLSHEDLCRQVVSVLDHFNGQDYFQEAFGYECVDAGEVPGTLGPDPAAALFRITGRHGIYPWWDEFIVDPPSDGVFFGEPRMAPMWSDWDPDTLFDVIEVMHDLVSKGIEKDSDYHAFDRCGWHFSQFDRAAGQAEYREEMNKVLRRADPPYELDERGHIVERTPDDFRPLLAAEVPAGTDDDRITKRMKAAVERFRTRGASLDDRRHAVTDLAGVLEALKPDIKREMLKKDESALFEIANNYAIRHNNPKQRGDYDGLIWLTWIFYMYLATIHAVLRVRAQQREEQA